MKPIDLTGRTFGLLTVVARAPSLPRGARWSCRCACGHECVADGSALRGGRTISCGCARRRHGHAAGGRQSGTYKAWADMLARCRLPKSRSWRNYGGRGIRVCERWGAFDNFLADMGERPAGTSLDRINNEGNYEPGNCRWATVREQNNNTRKNRYLTVDGLTLTIAEWTRRSGLPRTSVSFRTRVMGWTAKEAVTLPPFPQGGRRKRDERDGRMP